MGISIEVRGQLVLRFRVLFPHLNERQRRLVLGQEARLLGHGGVRAVARAAGVSETTVRAGVFELEAGDDPLPDGRVRRSGGGRRAAEDLDPDLVPALLALVEPDERGDPMSPLRWTTKSLRNLAGELTRQGYPVSAPTVGRLLREQGFSLQANAKTLEGKQHPDRDAQFRYVNEQVKAHQVAGQPVISVDAKKKEQLGHLPNAGRLWRPKGDPVQVEDHSFFFTGPDVPHAIPFGIYDMTADRGWVNVGVDHNTSAFAVASIRGWWTACGRHDYPNATRLLVTADAGGSNSCRYRLWKAELADFAAETGLAITVCHFPPGTSKWNKIEHRLFSHITMNWRGRPLTSHEVVVNLIAATRTHTGLRVDAALDTSTYPLGVSVSTERMKALPIAPHLERGTWNYTIHPAGQDRQAAAGPGQRQRARAAALHDLADPRLTGMSRRELEELAAELAPLQDARFEQRHFERRGGPRRQAKGKHGRPIFTSADRALIAIVYLRQICSQLVLSEMLEVSTGPITEAITETGKVLAERRHRIEPTVLRFTSAAALRDFLATDTVPSRPNRLATRGSPVLTGMSRPVLAKLTERLATQQAAQAQRRHHRRRGGDRQSGARGGIFCERSPTPNVSSQSSSACARSAPGRSWPNCSRSAGAPSATPAPGSARYWTRNNAPSAVPRSATPARWRYLPLSQDTKAHRPGPKHHFESLRLHYHRNLLTRVPKSAQPWVSTLVRTIFKQPDAAPVRAQHAQVTAALEAKFPAAAAHLDEARDDILAFTGFPCEVWRQIWSNNPQERLNKEIRRRTDVVGIFPGRGAIIRLVGAVLAEQNDEWTESRRYMARKSSPPA